MINPYIVPRFDAERIVATLRQDPRWSAMTPKDRARLVMVCVLATKEGRPEGRPLETPALGGTDGQWAGWLATAGAGMATAGVSAL